MPKGAVTPDGAKAGDATVQIALEGDAVVEGVVMEDARATGHDPHGDGGAERAEGEITAPLSGMDPKLAESKRVSATLNAGRV